MTLRVLDEKGRKRTEIAVTLGVTEGTVRYHLKRASSGAVDGRSNKPRKADEVADPIACWFELHKDERRPVNVQDLYDHLVEVHLLWWFV